MSYKKPILLFCILFPIVALAVTIHHDNETGQEHSMQTNAYYSRDLQVLVDHYPGIEEPLLSQFKEADSHHYFSKQALLSSPISYIAFSPPPANAHNGLCTVLPILLPGQTSSSQLYVCIQQSDRSLAHYFSEHPEQKAKTLDKLIARLGFNDDDKATQLILRYRVSYIGLEPLAEPDEGEICFEQRRSKLSPDRDYTLCIMPND